MCVRGEVGLGWERFTVKCPKHTLYVLAQPTKSGYRSSKTLSQAMHFQNGGSIAPHSTPQLVFAKKTLNI